MSPPANIYSVVVFDLHPKVRSYIDNLNTEGQIDLCDDGYPYLLSVEKTGSNYDIKFVRNGKQETVVMSSRKKAEPIRSWDSTDGFKRTGGKKVITVDTTSADAPRPERARRPSLESFKRLANEILKG
jgi:hypothetical protein